MESPAKPNMSPEDFRLIREFVSETFGLHLEEGKEGYLASRLRSRLEELRIRSFADYYSYLKFAPASPAEQLKFVSLLTNNETYFFREEAQLKVFADSVLPGLREARLKSGNRKIRIISAGCSTGEEAYTLAMLILESGKFVWEWDVEIIGVDIDAAAIAKAEAGVYAGRAFQSTPDHYLERYFRGCDRGLMVREVLRKMTRFVQGNLLNFERVAGEAGADIIFCRNVLIYFNDETTRRIVEGFDRVLARDGYLFLGHSESLLRITGRYLPLRFPGAIVYRPRD